MATVVRRPGGRFEIRESVLTAAGPRARTLAVFRVLSEEVLAKAEARAGRPFDREAVRRRARVAGAPVSAGTAPRAAREILGSLRRGERLPRALAVAVARTLPRRRGVLPDSIEAMLDWMGTADEERGGALRDLLRVSDRVLRSRTPRRRAELRYPRVPPAA